MALYRDLKCILISNNYLEDAVTIHDMGAILKKSKIVPKYRGQISFRRIYSAFERGILYKAIAHLIILIDP